MFHQRASLCEQELPVLWREMAERLFAVLIGLFEYVGEKGQEILVASVTGKVSGAKEAPVRSIPPSRISITAGSPSTPDSAAVAASSPACSAAARPSQGSASVRRTRLRLNFAILLCLIGQALPNRRERRDVEIVLQVRLDQGFQPRHDCLLLSIHRLV
jgi:hypothetical protein